MTRITSSDLISIAQIMPNNQKLLFVLFMHRNRGLFSSSCQRSFRDRLSPTFSQTYTSVTMHGALIQCYMGLPSSPPHMQLLFLQIRYQVQSNRGRSTSLAMLFLYGILFYSSKTSQFLSQIFQRNVKTSASERKCCIFALLKFQI